jgi:hypothetical protein
MAKRTNRVAWGLAAILVVALLGGVSVPYIWWRLPDAVVSLDGKRTTLPVYRSYKGDLLVWTREPQDEPFIIFSAESEVGPVGYQPLLDDLPETNHFLVSACFALVMDDGYHPGAMCSYYEGNRHASVHPGYVEFRAYSSSPRVRVKL